MDISKKKAEGHAHYQHYLSVDDVSGGPANRRKLCWGDLLRKISPSPSPFISFKNGIIQAIAMTHEQDN